jgi:hypothetical protein
VVDELLSPVGLDGLDGLDRPYLERAGLLGELDAWRAAADAFLNQADKKASN